MVGFAQVPPGKKRPVNAIPLETVKADSSEETEVTLDNVDSDGEAENQVRRNGSEENLVEDVEEGETLAHAHERHKARNLFLHVQLFSASLGAFAHGANDTASTSTNPAENCFYRSKN